MTSKVEVLLALLALSIVPGLARFCLARAGGMRVARLMFGLGPVLWARVGKKTRFQLHLVPLGLYTQVVGLDATDTVVSPTDPQAFANRPWFSRLVVLLGGAIGLLCFSAILVITSNLLLGVGTPG